MRCLFRGSCNENDHQPSPGRSHHFRPENRPDHQRQHQLLHHFETGKRNAIPRKITPGGSVVGTLPMMDPPSFLQKCHFIRQKRRFVQSLLHPGNNGFMIQITLDPLSYNPIAHRFGRLWQPQRLHRMYTCARERRDRKQGFKLAFP